MIVTATDFRNNIGKYISFSEKEDIIITKNGKYIARLVGFKKSGTPLTDSLIGVISCAGDIDLKKEQEAEIDKFFENYNFDLSSFKFNREEANEK